MHLFLKSMILIPPSMGNKKRKPQNLAESTVCEWLNTKLYPSTLAFVVLN